MGRLGSIGWGFGNGFRAEIEGNYRANEVDSIRGLNLAPIGKTGGLQSTYGVMVNAFYDFDFANFGMGQSIFQPYVGVGVGYAWTDWRNIRGQSNAPGRGGAVHQPMTLMRSSPTRASSASPRRSPGSASPA